MKRTVLLLSIIISMVSLGARAQMGASQVGAAASAAAVNENMKDSTSPDKPLNANTAAHQGFHVKRRYIFGGAGIIVVAIVAVAMSRRKKGGQPQA